MSDRRFKVVITDCDHGTIEEEKEEFSRIGADLVFAEVMKEDDLIRTCAEADGILNQYARLTRKVLENLPRCKVIVRYGIGVDSIDIKAATDLGIIIVNVPDYCIDEVADQAVALMLTLLRKTVLFDKTVRAGQWDFRLGAPIHRLRGKTLGLIGSGRIGFEVAKRIRPFGLRVIAYDPYLKEAPHPVELIDLDTLLKEADIISVHCPLNESTRHLIGEQAFQKMAKKPLIINTSRGAIIDEKSLIQALERNQIAGAGLDVFEIEPPDPQNPLLQKDNVVLSPHSGFYSLESISDLKRRAAESVSAVLRGKWPKSVVNREVKGKTRATILNNQIPSSK